MDTSGQTLLEVVISLGIGVIVVTALTIVTISGIRNSQFSQNQVRATKLAQDWIEQIRSFRDQNSKICNLGTVTDWNSSTGLFEAHNCSTASCYVLVQTDPTCTLKGVVQSQSDTSQYPFSRQASIQDYGTQGGQEKISVIVSWTDLSGSHQSDLVTILSQK